MRVTIGTMVFDGGTGLELRGMGGYNMNMLLRNHDERMKEKLDAFLVVAERCHMAGLDYEMAHGRGYASGLTHSENIHRQTIQDLEWALAHSRPDRGTVEEF
jgi:hypothetical protein